MVFPAVVDFVVLLGPARFAVFLAAYGGVFVELPGALSLFDALVLLPVVALTRGFDKARVHDAAFAGDEAFAFEMLAEGCEELATSCASLGFDALLEVPERFGVRDFVADAQAEEVLKAGAVEDLLLGGVVAQAVEFLQHEDFEHEHGVERRLASLAPVARGVASELFEQRAEALPRDEVAQFQDAGGFSGHRLLVLKGAE